MVYYDKNFKDSFDNFKNENPEFSILIIANDDFTIEFRSSSLNDEFSDNKLKNILNKWIEKENNFEFNNSRFVILKNDPYQFCAINTKCRIGICGSMTKSGKYSIAFLTQGTSNSLIESSVALNKWIWNLI